jgi:KAP family P-loop domain
MRYSDRPITRPGDDALGRSGFALEVARSIDNLTIANEGFVMALVGEWGSGKTSVIELIVRYLRHIEMEYQPAFPRSPTPAPWRHQSYPSSHAPKRGRDFRSWPTADVEIAASGVRYWG